MEVVAESRRADGFLRGYNQAVSHLSGGDDYVIIKNVLINQFQRCTFFTILGVDELIVFQPGAGGVFQAYALRRYYMCAALRRR